MSYCLAQDCDKKTTCSRWVGNCIDNQLHTSVDYSTMGSGGSNHPDIWYCGNKGLYKLYEQVPEKKSSTKGIMLFGNEEDLAYMKEKFSLLQRKVYCEDGKLKSPYRLLGELASQIHDNRWNS